VARVQRKEINIMKRVSFNRNVVQFYGFCLEKSAPMLVRIGYTLSASRKHWCSRDTVCRCRNLIISPAGPHLAINPWLAILTGADRRWTQHNFAPLKSDINKTTQFCCCHATRRSWSSWRVVISGRRCGKTRRSTPGRTGEQRWRCVPDTSERIGVVIFFSSASL
jgi:hypothetical protein